MVSSFPETVDGPDHDRRIWKAAFSVAVRDETGRAAQAVGQFHE